MNLSSESGEDLVEESFATQSEAAYFQLRKDIIAGDLEPDEKLLMERLRLQYRFGASPLREALSRLTAEQLVIARGQRGFRVAPISESGYRDIVDMRLFIETEALERSVRKATLRWEEDVTAAYKMLSRIESRLDRAPAELSAEWEQANQRFHFALIGNCDSPWLLRFVTSLSDQSARYRRRAITVQAVPQERLIKEHGALYEAAMERNAALAAELLKVHISYTADRLASALFS